VCVRSLAALAVPCLAIGLAACAGDAGTTPSTGSGTPALGGAGQATGEVAVYSSLPLNGASKEQASAIVDGIKLALKQAGNKAGTVQVKYESLDDSTVREGKWELNQVASNARKVAQDKGSVAVIGEFDSEATKVSLPILNQLGVAQISPANTLAGLTVDGPGSAPGEPERFQQTGKRTYARLVPRDTVQATALATQMKNDGCTNIAVASDKSDYGAGLAKGAETSLKKQGASVVASEGIQNDAAYLRGVADKLKRLGADCFLLGGVTANGAIQIYRQVAATLPDAKLYGGDGVCESSLTNPEKEGIPAKVGKNFACTLPTLDLRSYPGGEEFVKAFSEEYDEDSPDPYAIYGYEAMELTLDTIRAAGKAGATREGFIAQLFKTKDRDSVLGRYSIDASGDTSLTDYGLYKVGPDGDPLYDSTIKATG